MAGNGCWTPYARRDRSIGTYAALAGPLLASAPVHRPFTAAVLAVLALVGPAAAASPPPPPAPTPLTVKLTVSDSKPKQRRGVLFDASASSGGVPISQYVFRYGDGVQETSYQSMMMHAYANPGTYTAFVAVLDTEHRVAVSSPVTVTVRDGVPPVVAITSPRSGQHAHLGHSGFVITGTAVDPGRGASGVRTVQLALEYLQTTRSGGCPWFDGHSGLAIRACTNPLYFSAKLQGSHFSFRLNPHLTWPAGNYAIRVRATDYAGNTSDLYAVKLRTILGFRLAR